MGQNLSVESDDIKHFRKMVHHTYFGDIEKLKKHILPRTMGFQISRAAFIDFSQYKLSKIDSIKDSILKEEAMEKHLNEKMEFFSAVEEGKIYLGDTLLHVAVRLGHEDIVDYLLEMGLREDIPNFKGLTVIDCAQTSGLRTVVEDIASMHRVLGFNHDEGYKMYDAWEAGVLLRVTYDARSSHPAFTKLLKITSETCERYKERVNGEGIKIAIDLLMRSEGRAFIAKEKFSRWTNAEKLEQMYRILSMFFKEWKIRQSSDLEKAYLDFFNSAVEGWINFAEEHRLDRQNVKPDVAMMKRNEADIWRQRLHPPSEEVEDLCTHIQGLEKYLSLVNLKA